MAKINGAEAANNEKEIDVTKTRVHIRLPRPRPGEEDAVFVSNGIEKVLIKKGVDVDVPYWAWLILMQSDAAEIEAYNFEKYSMEKASKL